MGDDKPEALVPPPVGHATPDIRDILRQAQDTRSAQEAKDKADAERDPTLLDLEAETPGLTEYAFSQLSAERQERVNVERAANSLPALGATEESPVATRKPLAPDVQEKLREMQEANVANNEPITAADGMARLTDWLDTLIPDERTVEVIDVAGHPHTVLVLASAKKQTRVGRKIRKVLEKQVGSEFKLNGKSVARVLLDLAKDDEVLTAIHYAFTQLCRPALRDARKGEAAETAYEDLCEECSEEDKEAPAPLANIRHRLTADDLFPLEEMIAGVLPFSGRLIRRATRTLKN